MAKTIIGLALLALSLSGCSWLASASDKGAQWVGEYCQQPTTVRLTLRAELNRELARYGHSVCIDCAGAGDGCRRE